MGEVRVVWIVLIIDVFRPVVVVIVTDDVSSISLILKFYLSITPMSIRFVWVAPVTMLPFCF